MACIFGPLPICLALAGTVYAIDSTAQQVGPSRDEKASTSRALPFNAEDSDKIILPPNEEERLKLAEYNQTGNKQSLKTLRKLRSIRIPKIDFRDTPGIIAYRSLIVLSGQLDANDKEVTLAFDVRLIAGQSTFKSLAQPVTLSLSDVTLEDALRYTTNLLNLVYEVRGEMIYVRSL